VHCLNSYCVYYKENVCSLSEVELDEQGQCTSRVIVNVPEEMLTILRAELLERWKKDERK